MRGADGEASTVTIVTNYDQNARVHTRQSTSHSLLKLPLDYDHGCDCGSWDLSSDGLCVGLTDANEQSGGGGLQWSKSFEISWLSCININYNFSRSRISLGFGFDWRNYKSTLSGRCLGATADGGMSWDLPPADSRVRYTRLKIFSLQLPLFYQWDIPKTSLKFKVGPIACFNTYASLKTIYDDLYGNRCEDFTKTIDQRRFTVDFFGSLSYKGALGVYVRYSPYNVLRDGSPVNFRPLTIGIGFMI